MYHGDSRPHDQAVDAVMEALYRQLDDRDLRDDAPFDAEAGFGRLAERMRREAGPAPLPAAGPPGETAGAASAPEHPGPTQDTAHGQAGHPRRKKMSRKTKTMLALGAVAAAGAGAIIAARHKRLTDQQEIADAVQAPVLASVPAIYPASTAEWRTLLDSAPAQARQLHNVLRVLGVTDRPDGGGSVAVITLSADPGALALGPQLAVYAASLGIATALVIGPGPDTNPTAALRAACATASASQPGNLRAVSHRAIEDAEQDYAPGELTILVTVADADARPVVAALRATTTLLIGVSAGAATAGQLARVADVGDDRAVTGVLIANPETAGSGPAPGPGPAGAPGHGRPDRGSDITAAAGR